MLEIGAGSGLNLPLYGSAVDQVYGIDPSPELLDRADKRSADAHVSVSLVRASAEHLPFADALETRLHERLETLDFERGASVIEDINLRVF